MTRQIESHWSSRVRAVLCTLGVSAGALLAIPANEALAQAYPSRPVRIIVPNGAGSPTDIVARLLGVGHNAGG